MPFTHPERLVRVAGGSRGEDEEEEGKELSCGDPEDYAAAAAALLCPALVFPFFVAHCMALILENICLSDCVDEDINQNDGFRRKPSHRVKPRHSATIPYARGRCMMLCCS